MKNTLFLKIFLFIFISNAGVLCSQNVTNSSESIKKLLEKKRNYNKTVGFGYVIQIYNGAERNAKSKRSRFRILYPRVASKLIYNSPEWKVQVGNYKTKLEADRANLLFRNEFSGTIVVPVGK
ncbi:SPOR domain-containing protein [uncultured Polaribacter sp.]|uniref:SPOR domain-containing protein n=1 Tax=uncultured Polaribacter sp. TaxID=174711 RepID=UPI00260887A6|nr:SPOR domain-containing protein [uncultured Polaribacter sp.]